MHNSVILRRKSVVDGVALVYCDEFFSTMWGKTAHGLVRFTKRYDVLWCGR